MTALDRPDKARIDQVEATPFTLWYQSSHGQRSSRSGMRRGRRFPDKNSWGDGLWINERQASGLTRDRPVCMAKQQPLTGSVGGYAGSPRAPVAVWTTAMTVSPLSPRWAGLRRTMQEATGAGRGTRSKSRPGETDDVWWLGFDTEHQNITRRHSALRAQDPKPYDDSRAYWETARVEASTYKTWVRPSEARLAAQIRESR